MKRIFSTIGSIIETSAQGPVLTFLPDDSLRDLLGFNKNTIYEEYNLLPNPVDTILIDNNFLETIIARGMISKGKRSGIIHNWTITVDLGFKYVERFAGGISWYMMETKYVISIISFTLKTESFELVSLNGQSISFRLSIKEI